MKRLVNWFLQGLLLLVPVSATIYVFVSVFLLIDGFLPLDVPGLGFLILVCLTILAGFLASSFFAGKMQKTIDALFRRVPFVKLLYGAVRDLLGAFVGNERRFEHPVLVELFPGGAHVIGFVTRPSLDQLGRSDLAAVYLPQSYNFSGLVIFVPKASIRPLPVSSADAMALALSGGVSLGAVQVSQG
jgi:uncharacterized membrane protein